MTNKKTGNGKSNSNSNSRSLRDDNKKTGNDKGNSNYNGKSNRRSPSGMRIKKVLELMRRFTGLCAFAVSMG
ncbi:hypothetical protein [Tunturiibacter lichenicola]|uniref:hypothetical protein n=1 Tax=Tunturiibacter lichenicola TaxID=2051959 RepID=UPI003D9B2FF8